MLKVSDSWYKNTFLFLSDKKKIIIETFVARFSNEEYKLYILHKKYASG